MDKKNIKIDQSHASFNNASTGVDLTGAKIENLNLKTRANLAWGELSKDFWFVRKKLAIVVMFSILFVSLIFIFSGVFWIEQAWAVDNIIKGLFVFTFTLVYYFTFKAKVKNGVMPGFKGFWLTLDLLFLGIVFWVLL